MEFLTSNEYLSFVFGIITFMLWHITIIATKKKDKFSLKLYFGDIQNIINYLIAIFSGLGILISMGDVLFKYESMHFLSIMAYMGGLMNFEIIKGVRNIISTIVDKFQKNGK